MNTHLWSGLWALAFTILIATAMAFSRDSLAQPWLDPWITFPVMPGFYLGVLLGIRGGTDGLPNFLFVLALTVVVWWVIFDLAYALWRTWIEL